MVSFKEKILECIKNPKSIFYYLFRRNYKWEADSKSDSLKKKKYNNYDEYVKHQKEKFDRINKGMHEWFPKYDVEFRQALKERLNDSGFFKERGKTILCLAARLGTEVKAFLDLGCFAVGVDLNPGKDNKYVLSGDFHSLQFADNSVDIVFSNSMDHAFDFDKLIAEIIRVLKADGILVLDIIGGEDENSPGYYEVHSWKSIDDLLRIFENKGFKIVKRSEITCPWKGEHVYMSIK